MNYKEPGVYLSVVNSSVGAMNGIQMLPCIIGPGASVFSNTEAIVRSATTKDALSRTGASSIVKISDYKGGPAAYQLTTDYTLVNEVGVDYISWNVDCGPAEGETYYVEYLHAAQESQFDVNLIHNRETLIAMYGEDIKTYENGTPINTLSLAGQLLFTNGASPILVCQVASVGEIPTKAEFQVGLDKLAAIGDIWRIVPTVVTADIITAITQHIMIYSSYEERAERTSFLSIPYDGTTLISPTAFAGVGGVLDVVGTYAEGLGFKREAIPYPDRATYTFSDGVKRSVGGQMLMAALAGAEAAQPISASRTRLALSGFYSLDGVKMTRSEMNTLAPKGVTILTQSAPGRDIIVRHGVTTDFATTQSREISLVAIEDYCAKNFRAASDKYIGKYNITNELLSMVKGTTESRIAEMVKKGIIISGIVLSVVQDAENPDAVAMAVRVFVPYPCNYIDITMYLV